jgi:hypothetical protein
MNLIVFALSLPFLQLQTREIREHTPECFIEFKCPEIANDAPFNLYVQQTLNALIKGCRDNATLASGEPNVGSYLKGTYRAATLKTGIVTVLFDRGMYITGAAHPAREMASINYDPSTHRVLRLSDLFRPGVDYLSRLSQLAINSLKQQGEDYFADSDTVRKGDFTVFILTNTALVLQFPGGPAGTEYEAVIPLNALGSILRKRYLPPSPR